ncbi:MAG: phosphoglucosamine mutase, partial [Actinomycetes bacterium]|nr:phosphoglucosamine mutase [Actinomycetes bacterium]
MAHVLFGTDGIRGVANRELTPEMAFRLGQAIVAVMGNKGRAADPTHPRFLIGRDTRRSGAMLQGALAAGITSSGGDALLAGIVPTPALAALLRPLTCAGGVMISASHNPPEYNGLKVFAGSGYKLSDADEAALETLLQTDPLPFATRPVGTAVGRVIDIPDAAERYVARLVS